jgi:hypothetical protein
LSEGVFPVKAVLFGWVYEVACFAALFWVLLSTASPISVVAFMAVSCSGLALFDNYLLRRPYVLRGALENAGLVLVNLVMVGLPLVLTLGFGAPWQSALCAAVFVVSRLLLRGQAPQARHHPRLRDKRNKA